MQNDLLAKYQRPVPRYTSYPTAPHFHDGIGPGDYGRWLREIPQDTALSLYLHVPFCDTLCWFCGCHTSIVRRYQPVARYFGLLIREIDLVAAALGEKRRAVHIHFGGGSPTILAPGDVTALSQRLSRRFGRDAATEFAIEIDPRGATREMIDTWALAGLTRASLGVQDFNQEVQQAINREQSFECTAQVIGWLRDAGVRGLNLDLMYGLPHQTVERVLYTVEQVLRLDPDRIALFGYAHLPDFKHHQRLIDDNALPGAGERLAQAEAAAARLVQAGFVRIGLDHFAKPDDALARALAAGTLHRNFQGYTTDAAPALIGLGASSIGSLPQGYVQNAVPVRRYGEAIKQGRLATVRGIRLDDGDKARRRVIERLMCDFHVDLDRTGAANGEATGGGAAENIYAAELAALAPMAEDGLVEIDGARISVTDAGRPLVRSICAVFDTYLGKGKASHSRPV